MFQLPFIFLVLTSLVSCKGGLFGGKNDSSEGEPGPERENTNFSDLENTVPTENATLVSNFSATDEHGIMGYVGFYQGLRYLSATVRKIDGKTYQIMAVTGNYLIKDGQLQIKGKRASCPQAVKSNYTIVGTPDSPTLTVSHDHTTVILPRTQKAFDVSSGLVLQWGCFNQNGEFTPKKWNNL